ncbi:hypothetical protein EDI_045730 [Entamoeba dispar SAW760]|uniref:TLDc domain-containing protein n=1 Tax=Entamoeba dispar (strain ATCC PRA-260 / SAW760) TaxID=370354 RepID=B0EE23_ENTDS|nr:uncharacterized protein EDI_045730 [Entamoeba dispar SAW760]EDR27209.1 hypothetical protein EDI_045730 [Entamoeba dispar SAW760]|eukprot:EDR27209.1 hypothetical protein EDI_045730 [Entamoeba dispar SAW760]
MSTDQEERLALLQELQTTFNMVKIQIEEFMKSEKDYNAICEKRFKEEEIVDVQNESLEDRIKRIEGVYDRKEELVRRNEIVNYQIKDGILMLKAMKEVYQKLEEIRLNDYEVLSKQMDTIIAKVLETEKERTNKLISESPYRKCRYQGELNKTIKEWESRKLEVNFLLLCQIKQIEEWTNRKVSNILFDSDIDDWNYNTSVFKQRIINKKHITIIIEDEDGNKFGGYVNMKIDNVGCRINDSNAFVFSLESNGRIQEMMKFDIKDPQYAFGLYNQLDGGLFEFGGNDIYVCKENNKTKSCCKQSSFEYKGISNVLCGRQCFTPERIIVIEMK